MCYREILVRTSSRACIFHVRKITLVVSVGDQFHRSPGHGLEFLLHERGDRYYRTGLIQNLPFHLLVPSFSGLCHGQMLEIEYLGPWITEVGNPWKTGLLRQQTSDHVH